jgi:hypothetical protein
VKRLIVLLFICVLIAGCAGVSEPDRHIHPKFRQGEIVELRLGPIAQIVYVYQWGDNIHYDIRTIGQNGPVLTGCVHEFELRAKDD